jgi:hypothetical protein
VYGGIFILLSFRDDDGNDSALVLCRDDKKEEDSPLLFKWRRYQIIIKQISKVTLFPLNLWVLKYNFFKNSGNLHRERERDQSTIGLDQLPSRYTVAVR